MKKTVKQYMVTGFYCLIHKGWHYINEAQFHECIDICAAVTAFQYKVIESPSTNAQDK